MAPFPEVAYFLEAHKDAQGEKDHRGDRLGEHGEGAGKDLGKLQASDRQEETCDHREEQGIGKEFEEQVSRLKGPFAAGFHQKEPQREQPEDVNGRKEGPCRKGFLTQNVLQHGNPQVGDVAIGQDQEEGLPAQAAEPEKLAVGKSQQGAKDEVNGVD